MFDTFVNFPTTYTSVTLSVTENGVSVITISTGVKRGLIIRKNIKYEIVIQKYNKQKNFYERHIKL